MEIIPVVSLKGVVLIADVIVGVEACVWALVIPADIIGVAPVVTIDVVTDGVELMLTWTNYFNEDWRSNYILKIYSQSK